MNVNGDDSHAHAALNCFESVQHRKYQTSSPFTWKGLIETLDNDAVKESSLFNA